MILLLMLEGTADSAMTHYHALTAAEKRCVMDASRTDVTVCGLRGADRFRVPFIAREPGDPAIQDVPQERGRLIARRSPLEDLSPFLVGGGMVGVHFTTRSGLGVGEARKPAP
ncbi:hypothetical protein ACM61V_06980 [Sphingomonas sp. TX0543]|uniref:hypothetical protein n=1 Tax=unclassified Sphingomonas TaxID=196159 RepID=UPI0010F7AFD3|nr:hypothetical protein [Sphingomonas sp. 3P27F8]